MRKILALGMAAAMSMALAACGSSASAPATTAAPTTAAPTTAAPATTAAPETTAEAAKAEATVVASEAKDPEPQGGFTEIPIWEDEEVAFMNVNGVYFQPVPMSNGNENFEDYDMHFEADVAALENDLGYGKGDWIPYLTVDYEIIGSDGKTAAEGTFMPMSADDGPHYGANIKLPNADTYSVRLKFHSPEENGYLIHLDDETGPGGTLDKYFGDGPLELYLENVWDYVPQEW